jgi:FrmR/RcnR family transcriptional regulator, repressor of frmRAB operon
MHVQKDKKKLLDRVARLRGQVDAIYRALEQEEDCSKVLQTISACRGAMQGLMAEVVEGHIRSHILTNVETAEEKQAQAAAAEDVIDIVKSYLK